MRFSPDGQAITYLFPRPGTLNQELWAYDLHSGESRCLARAPQARTYSLEDELIRERQRNVWEGITDYQLVRETVLVPYGGKLYYGRGDGTLNPIPATEGAQTPILLADGRRFVFSRNGGLFVGDLRAGTVRALVGPAIEGMTYGTAEFVAQEELGRSEGFWVSPDMDWIALTETDVRHVPPFPITRQDNGRVTVEEHRYPFAGEDNAQVRLGVMPLAGGPIRWLAVPFGQGYLARVQWTPAGDVAVTTLTRDQRHLKGYVVNPATGHIRWTWSDDDPLWVEWGREHFLSADEMLYISRKSGRREVYRKTADGQDVSLDSGPFTVQEILDVDRERGIVYVAALAERALQRHVVALGLEPAPPRRLTAEDGWHQAVFSPDHLYYVCQSSDLATPWKTTVWHTGGQLVATLHEAQDVPAGKLTVPDVVEVAAEDGTILNGALYRPPESAPKPWPVVVSVYGGPGVQRVARSWDVTVDMEAQFLAQHGYLVFKLDGRGSANRGRDFEAPLYRRLGTVELDDQVAGINWLKRQQPIDPERVGIYGWSYGGFMTLTALLKAPGIFRAGVAGAPVTDFRWYDTAYTERYLGTPQDNPAGYEAASLIPLAPQLQGHLLIVHGLLDENVHFRHTAEMVQALIEAGKNFDQVVLPASRHSLRGLATRRFWTQKLMEFLFRYV